MTYINFLKRQIEGTGSENTAEGAIIRTGGKHVQNTIVLNANNTSAFVNVFEFTGTIDIKAVHAEVTVANTLNNCTAVYIDIYDGTNAVVLSKTTGAVLSGYGVGSFIIKNAAASAELATINNDQVRLTEPVTGTKSFSEFLITAKAGVTNYIRFHYSTTDAPIDAEIELHINYADIDSGTITAI